MGICQTVIGFMAITTTAKTTHERRAIRADALTGTNDATIHQFIDAREQDTVPIKEQGQGQEQGQRQRRQGE